MMEYTFGTVAANRGFFVGKTLGYQEVIRQRAEQGWRYVGWIPSKQEGNGAIMEIDLIFERETEGQA